MNDFHVSVLLQETIDALHIEKGKKYIDATLGGGGHSLEIVKRGGIVLGIDQDQEAIEFVKKQFTIDPLREASHLPLTIARGNFRDIKKIAKDYGFGKVSGIIFDLGISSWQIDSAERGFSFQRNGPLDMRMSFDSAQDHGGHGVTAKDLINGLREKELYEIFINYGEEYRAKSIVRAICLARQVKPIETTEELARIIEGALGFKNGVPTPKIRAQLNSKVFQALRIAVNDELHSLIEGLEQSLTLLENNGTIAVITFHSLEDRIVKRYFKDCEQKGIGKNMTKKPITPSLKEQETNRRSRSAKLRVLIAI